MTKPSYEELRRMKITKHPEPLRSIDSASDFVSDQTAMETRFCERHCTEKMWANCGNCSDGFTSHDCGEDCCACLYPEDNVRCDICYGEGGFYLCPICAPDADF